MAEIEREDRVGERKWKRLEQSYREGKLNSSPSVTAIYKCLKRSSLSTVVMHPI